MIVVRIELWPKGRQVNVRELGRVHITNTGQGTEHRGDYLARLFRRSGKVWRDSEVRDFPRKSLGPYDLLFRALLAARGHRHLRALRAFIDQHTKGETP